MHRNVSKAYHIDYIFASENIIKKGFQLQIDDYSNWKGLSDYSPIIANIPDFISVLNLQNSFEGVFDRFNAELSAMTSEKFEIELEDLKQLSSDLDSGCKANIDGWFLKINSFKKK